MVIGINGDLIDVSKIYQISEIEYNLGNIDQFAPIVDIEFKFRFEILFLNGIQKYYDFKRIVNLKIEELEVLNYEYTNLKEFKIYHDEISQFRKAIIDVWSQNQSTIPQFNMELKKSIKRKVINEYLTD